MGRPCARQSNIPRPPFPRRNRRDEVHAARSAQTICAFRRGGCHPPAGRTLCAPTLRVLFLGRVELQGEVRDMGPGRRCHAAAAARRAAVPTPFVPAGHFPLTGGIGPAVRNTNTRAFSTPWFVFLTPVHPHCSARLRASLSRCGTLAGRVAFAAARAGLRAASRPCARPRFAPSSPAHGLRASHCHAADWAHGRVDKPSDSGQTRFGLWPSLGSAHPFPNYLPCAPMGRA